MATASQAEVVRAVLIAMGLGSSPDADPLEAWPTYASAEPTTPDNCITCYSTAGGKLGRLMNGQVLGPSFFQIRVRSTTAPIGRSKMEDIFFAISEELYDLPVVINGDTYLVHAAVRIGDIIELGMEIPKSKRLLFTLNAALRHKQTS